MLVTALASIRRDPRVRRRIWLLLGVVLALLVLLVAAGPTVAAGVGAVGRMVWNIAGAGQSAVGVGPAVGAAAAGSGGMCGSMPAGDRTAPPTSGPGPWDTPGAPTGAPRPEPPMPEPNPEPAPPHVPTPGPYDHLPEPEPLDAHDAGETPEWRRSGSLRTRWLKHMEYSDGETHGERVVDASRELMRDAKKRGRVAEIVTGLSIVPPIAYGGLATHFELWARGGWLPPAGLHDAQEGMEERWRRERERRGPLRVTYDYSDDC